MAARWRKPMHDGSKARKTERTPDSAILIGMTEGAKMLGISTRTLWTLTNAGEIPHVRIGRRVLLNVCAVREWIAARTEGGAA